MNDSPEERPSANEKPRTRRAFLWRMALRIVLAALAVIATALVFHDPIYEEEFMGDETDWISSGNYYSGLLLSGDFEHEKWVANHLGIVGNFNPQLGKVLMGLGIRLHPQREPGDTEYIATYDWGRPEAVNRAQGRVPPKDLLVRARQSSFVFVAGCAVLLFFAGTLFAGEAAGVVLVALMLASTRMHRLFALAMTDSYYNFFILMGLITSYFLVRAQTTRSFVSYSALMGLAAGLACSVKITGLPLLAFFYCLLLPGIWAAHGFEWRTTVYGPAAAIVAAVFTAYLLNPFYWPFESPRLLWEFPNLFLRTREAFLDVPEAAREWGSPPDRWRAIHGRLFRSDFLSFRFEPLFFAVGLALSGWSLAEGLRKKAFNPLGVPAIYCITHYVFLVSLIQFNFARYYLPLVFALKLLAAIGITAPVYWIARRYFARPTPGTDSNAAPHDLHEDGRAPASE